MKTLSVHTTTIRQKYGPLVVDIWEPQEATDVTPILLVHGWGGTGSYWKHTADELSKTARVIVPDLPGTGRSQPVSRAQNMFAQVDALVTVLDELELDKVQLVGHSMGGAMALLLADARPEQIERVVLTSLTFFRTQHQKDVYRSVMKAFKVTMRLRGGWMSHLPGMEQMMAKNYFHQVPKNNPMLHQGWVDFLELDASTATACANDATDPAIPAAGINLQVPVLLIACRQDRMMPMENVDYTANLIPDCTVRWIEKCGHLPMVEKPQEYMSLLREFLVL